MARDFSTTVEMTEGLEGRSGEQERFSVKKKSFGCVSK